MLRFPPPLDPASFLDRYWQKEPVALPGAMPRPEPFISADELAWLATLDDVESRLVFTELRDGRTKYRVRQGPFSERQLARLPGEHWTLLVHDVEKHLPDFRSHFAAVDFIPDWRIDDLMISVAAPGGSVGPHVDNYDVFLCQADGAREWRLAAAGSGIPAARESELALLEPFDCDEPLTMHPPDVLYLPPGIPHWGIATSSCITFSLGMRAPTRGELHEALEKPGESRGNLDDAGEQAGENEVFYRDPDLRAGESEPGMISSLALQRAARLLDRPADVPPLLLAQAFGELVTTPKAWLAPESPDTADTAALLARLSSPGDVSLHGMARVAWCMLSPRDALVFANGRSRAVESRSLVEFRRMCETRMLHTASLRDAESDELLRWLIAAGAFDPDLGEDDGRV